MEKGRSRPGPAVGALFNGAQATGTGPTVLGAIPRGWKPCKIRWGSGPERNLTHECAGRTAREKRGCRSAPGEGAPGTVHAPLSLDSVEAVYRREWVMRNLGFVVAGALLLQAAPVLAEGARPQDVCAGTKAVAWTLRSGPGREGLRPVVGLTAREEIAASKPVLASLRMTGRTTGSTDASAAPSPGWGEKAVAWTLLKRERTFEAEGSAGREPRAR
jgi:hypothetical protein